MPMFGRSKRRDEEEEEDPLVPHGLVWQATEDADVPAPQLVKPAEVEDNQASSEVVDMPARATPQPQPSAPKNTGAISPPLQWPSANIQGIVRHPEPRNPEVQELEEYQGLRSLPQVSKEQPERAHAPAASSIAQSTVPDAKADFVVVARASAASTTRAAVSRMHSVLRSGGLEIRELSQQAFRALRAFSTASRAGVTRMNLSGRAANSFQAASAHLTKFREKSRPVGTAAVLRLKTWRQAVALYSISATRNSGHKLRAFDFGWASRSLQRARDLKIKIRIPHAQTSRITALSAAVGRPWERLRRVNDRDSRLWTSMAMAGLSALLALGVVSGLRKYDPDNTSSGRMNPVSLSETVQAADNSRAQQSQHAQKPAATAESTTPRPTPAITKPVQAETRTEAAKVSTVNSSAQAAATNAASHSHQRVHYSANDDDDYVAKDTYVIYGSNGKPLRR